jgi:hypothetical protein
LRETTSDRLVKTALRASPKTREPKFSDEQQPLGYAILQTDKGARFEFPGKTFEKCAMSMAHDECGNGSVFQGGIEVSPIGQWSIVAAARAEAERWKPFQGHWTELMFNRRF